MTDPMFGHRYTAIPDSGVVELHCGTHNPPVTWEVGYHPSLDVLIDQARAHDVAEHDNDSAAEDHERAAEVMRLRGTLEEIVRLTDATVGNPEIADFGDAGRLLTAINTEARRGLDATQKPQPAPDRITEDTRAYVATRAGGYVTAAMVQRRVHIGWARAATVLNQMADGGEISLPDSKGRYTVPHAPATETVTKGEG
jgi:hypothetical protein